MPRYDIDTMMLPPSEEETEVRVYNGVDYSRQMKLFNPFEAKDVTITVVGAGAVGSYTVLTLAKMGFRNFFVWDDDVVSAENLPNQFYPINSIGRLKVDALHDIVEMFTGLEIVKMPKRWNAEEHETLMQGHDADNILIMCTDNMASRKMCSEYFKKSDSTNLFIDARMGGLVYRVFMMTRRCWDYCVEGAPLKKGLSYPLFTDDAAHQDPCTAKSIIFNVAAIASTIAALIRIWFMDGGVNYKEVIGDMKNIQIVDGDDIAKLM